MNIKHQSHKNADYATILEYYTEVHIKDPQTGLYEPVLDEHGIRQPREHCHTIYINAHGEDDDPENFVRDCILTNRRYHQNQDREDVKNHEYILSHPAEDRPLLTDAMLEQEARTWAKKYGKGYQVLISIHRDTDNDHIHITINSVRECAREEQPWMQKGANKKVLDCETRAGGKHQQSIALRYDMNDWALEYTREHGLKEEDNNQKARETAAARYSERNRYLRDVMLECMQQEKDAKMLRWFLRWHYGIDLIVRGKTVSVKHPDAKRATRLRNLGLTPEDLGIGVLNAPEKSTEDVQMAHMWQQFKEANDDFMYRWKEIAENLKKEEKAHGEAMHKLKLELTEIRKNEKILRDGSIFKRRDAKKALAISGNSRSKQAEIAHESKYYNQSKERVQKLKKAIDLFDIYSHRAYAAMEKEDWEGFHYAMESMRLVKNRLPNQMGTYAKEDWDSLVAEMEFMRGLPEAWEAAQELER